jgi:hypothetical protein
LYRGTTMEYEGELSSQLMGLILEV